MAATRVRLNPSDERTARELAFHVNGLYPQDDHSRLLRLALAEIDCLREHAAARAALLADGPTVNYTGPDDSVECAYPPCRNRLRYASFGSQFCSKQHRDLAGAEREPSWLSLL